ncbi:MAG: hypothetical protein BAJALOKI3v1_50055 [Promethearchaeota archaeon]|nr:MAG: hypothetical protein BAJALOKI3v1_50055 [Candidatus Lokiarchaeota archaeon]
MDVNSYYWYISNNILKCFGFLTNYLKNDEQEIIDSIKSSITKIKDQLKQEHRQDSFDKIPKSHEYIYDYFEGLSKSNTMKFAAASLSFLKINEFESNLELNDILKTCNKEKQNEIVFIYNQTADIITYIFNDAGLS